MSDVPSDDLAGLIAEASASLLQFSRLAEKFHIGRTKPILGGPFGSAGYVLGSCHCVWSGLDEAIYFVIHRDSRFVIGHGPTRADALRFARSWMAYLGAARIAALASQFMAESREIARGIAANPPEFAAVAAPRVPSISRRRRRLFEEGGGRCYYCKCELTLESSWHVDHKFPRALGGGNERENLVVACAPCNLRKSAKTDAEFIADSVA